MRKQPHYTLSLIVTILLTLAAFVTLLPTGNLEINALGYGSLCSFTPWSSLVLLLLAGLSCVTRAEGFKQKHPATHAR